MTCLLLSVFVDLFKHLFVFPDHHMREVRFSLFADGQLSVRYAKATDHSQAVAAVNQSLSTFCVAVFMCASLFL